MPLASMFLIDGHAATSLFVAASLSQANLVLSTKRMQRQAYGWIERTQTMTHAEFGGVTAKTEQLVVYFPAKSPFGSFVPRLEASPGRDASTVLLVDEYCQLLRPIPVPLEVFPLWCVNLGSKAWPVYHGAGLLHLNLSCIRIFRVEPGS